MAAALKFAKYDYKFEFGDGVHSPKHGGCIFPETMLGSGATTDPKPRLPRNPLPHRKFVHTSAARSSSISSAPEAASQRYRHSNSLET